MYFVEGVIVFHEGTNALAEVIDLDADIPRKELLSQRPMIMIVSGYTLARQSSMANPDHMEWVPTSLCENTSFYSPKESVPDLIEFVVICEAIVVF